MISWLENESEGQREILKRAMYPCNYLVDRVLGVVVGDLVGRLVGSPVCGRVGVALGALKDGVGEVND